MASSEQVGSIIESVGPRDHNLEGIVQRDDGEYVVHYDDLEVTLEFEADTDRLVISAELGDAPRDKRLAVYTTLLNYSLLWRDTGGVHMALTADGIVVQTLTLSGSEITVDLLDTVLRNFAAKARLMRTYVATGGGNESPVDSLMPLGLRV
jgi:hypothetical protein